MGFGQLLGNDSLKEQLQNAFARGRASHFYLLTGPEGSGKHTLARLLAAAFVCQEQDKPCLRCPACRKVLDGVHPDFITVEDPEHKNVAVKIIRQVRDDMFVRPNEASHKIYFLPQSLGVEGQNALLKILEEPPPYGVFLLLADNPEKLLPTVRSRCVELRLRPLGDAALETALRREFPEAEQAAIAGAIARSGGYLGQAKMLLSQQPSLQTVQFVQAMATRDRLLLTQILVPMEKWKRDQAVAEWQQWLAVAEGAMATRAGVAALSPLSGQCASARTAAQWNATVEKLKKAMEYAQANVSVAAICGWLARAL